MKTVGQRTFRSIVLSFWLLGLSCAAAHGKAPPHEDVTLYASFDEEIIADFGGGNGRLQTRMNDSKADGGHTFNAGYPFSAFSVAKEQGVHGGALLCADVLPHRGRIFFPAQGNLAFKRGGWGGAASFWLKTDPNVQLQTPFCDPIQITHKGAHDGGIWIDFPDTQPRDMRMGVFRGLAAEEKPLKESDPQAAIVRLPKVGFTKDRWHHVVMTWENFDTGEPNARAGLYVDGRLIGEVKDRELAMEWDIEKTGIYIGVNLIGMMDELAVFKRSLTADEVAFLHEHPRYLHDGNGARQSEAFVRRELCMRELERTARVANSRALPLEPTRSDLLKVTATNGHQANTQRAVNLLVQFPPAGKEPPVAPKFPFDAKTAAAYQTGYAKWAGLPLEITNRQGIQLRLIPPGLFQMGSPDDEPGRGQDGRDESLHDVRLTRPFYLGVHEITVGQFNAFVRAASHKTNGERNDGGHAHDELAVWKHRPGTEWRKPGYAGPFVMLTTHPVVHVSHNDATAYCKWLNENSGVGAESELVYTLPTEAQWEWACRGGSAARFWWGDEVDESGVRLNVGDRTLKRVHPDWPRETMPMDDRHAFAAPVGSFSPNPLGVYDMLGNVWEFCGTRYGPYPQELSVNPGDFSDEGGFAVRGGGWSNTPRDVRCATRNADPPTFCHSNLGFRVVLTLPERP